MKKIIRKLRWAFNDASYTVSAFLKPRQKWLTRVIPRKWCDKPELMRDVLFAFIVDYVEGEDGLRFRGHDWKADLEQGHVSQEYIDSTNKILDRIYDVYSYITLERPSLESYLSNDDCSNYIPASKMLGDRDRWALKEIIELREYLWT
jgi:hypothetical protein